jgi:TRAP-type C4-dicarboxylate transport system permease small subunit
MIYFEKIIDLVAWLSAWLFCIAGFMLSYEVVARYFFLAPTSWAAELSQLSLIYGTLLAMPWALKSRKHIQINLVINKLSKTYKKIINILIMMILIIFSSYVMIFGFEIFYDSFFRGRTTGSLLNLPSWIAELSVPLCFFLLFIQSIFEIIKLLKNIEPPESNH